MLLIAMKATKNLVSVPLVLYFSKFEKYETVIYEDLTGG